MKNEGGGMREEEGGGGGWNHAINSLFIFFPSLRQRCGSTVRKHRGTNGDASPLQGEDMVIFFCARIVQAM